MNRQQAEHILDAYIKTIKFVDDEEPSVALREVILDAMTSYTTITTYPSISYTPRDIQPYTTKPIVTC